VFFEGEVNSADVLSYYPIFSIKVLASNMEGLSQSLLEAMALGIPVIATNAAGNPDLVQHELNGLLFGDGDIEALSAAIIRLKSDPNFAKILRNQGKKTALETFSLQNTILGYEEYFHQLLKNS
jgi:glycosyltransferase involved in cell wall biosynthesis